MIYNIVFIGINYHPEDSAIGLYTTQMAEFLAEGGHNISVITGFPYYPQWEIAADYKSKSLLYKEKINGVNILRYRQYVPSNPTFPKRILHMFSFTFGNFINLFRLRKPDIVISIIPFTTSALLGIFLKFRYKSKLWIHIQDFEFDAAFGSGLIRTENSKTLKALLWIEKKIFDRADVISTISHGMMEKLIEKSDSKHFYFPNWIDISLFNTFNHTEKHPYLSSDKFKILYSGNIGAKQDWNFFCDFLESIKKLDNVEVVVVGEGAEKNKLKDMIKGYNFVKHHNLVPYEELPWLLMSADLHILFQKDTIIDTVMPSKLLGMMASNKPSIVTGNAISEVAKIFSVSKAGYFFESNSLNNIYNSVLILMNDLELRASLGNNAKYYVTQNFTNDHVLNNFLEHIKKM